MKIYVYIRRVTILVGDFGVLGETMGFTRLGLRNGTILGAATSTSQHCSSRHGWQLFSIFSRVPDVHLETFDAHSWYTGLPILYCVVSPPYCRAFYIYTDNSAEKNRTHVKGENLLSRRLGEVYWVRVNNYKCTLLAPSKEFLWL